MCGPNTYIRPIHILSPRFQAPPPRPQPPARLVRAVPAEALAAGGLPAASASLGHDPVLYAAHLAADYLAADLQFPGSAHPLFCACAACCIINLRA